VAPGDHVLTVSFDAVVNDHMHGLYRSRYTPSAGDERTVIATHDPRLIEIASALAVRSDREPGHVTFQFRMGVQPQARAELLAGGASVSVLVPFGPDWAAYMARRIAGRPSALRSAARSALSR